MNDVVLIYTTWPDAEVAERVGAEAVAERLAACANVLAPMRSIFRWEGAIDRAVEVPMLLKTTAAQAGRVRDFVLAHHPYEVPAVLVLPVLPNGSNPAFLDWIVAETGGAERAG